MKNKRPLTGVVLLSSLFFLWKKVKTKSFHQKLFRYFLVEDLRQEIQLERFPALLFLLVKK